MDVSGFAPLYLYYFFKLTSTSVSDDCTRTVFQLLLQSIGLTALYLFLLVLLYQDQPTLDSQAAIAMFSFAITFLVDFLRGHFHQPLLAVKMY